MINSITIINYCFHPVTTIVIAFIQQSHHFTFTKVRLIRFFIQNIVVSSS